MLYNLFGIATTSPRLQCNTMLEWNKFSTWISRLWR